MGAVRLNVMDMRSHAGYESSEEQEVWRSDETQQGLLQ